MTHTPLIWMIVDVKNEEVYSPFSFTFALYVCNQKIKNMRPIKFKFQNTVFAKDQPEYGQLPAYVKEGSNGEVISCWKLSFRERLRVLIFGKVWLDLMTFNKPLTPSMLSTDRKELFLHPDDLKPWYKKLLKMK